MINAKEFYLELYKNGIDFFTGVPDSTLKGFCTYLMKNVQGNKHIIAANEGNAISIAAGYNIATNKIPAVYMQNSGLGNTINPLTSLTDKSVYNIPMLLIIGWRGRPGETDEPQHIKQGSITLEQLTLLGIKYKVLERNHDMNDMRMILEDGLRIMEKNQEVFAIIISDGSLEQEDFEEKSEFNFEMDREEALIRILSYLDENSLIISSTGMASREIFEYREKVNEGHKKDFLVVGSMGHASQIALGMALANKDKEFYCIDGDGALIMHMGTMAVIGNKGTGNFKHILINNGSYGSVGGFPTEGFNIDICKIAIACGYKNAWTVTTSKELESALVKLKQLKGPSILEVRVNKNFRKNLGRPTLSPKENKKEIMKFLNIN